MRTSARALLIALLAPASALAVDPAPRPPPLAHRSSISAVLAQASALKLSPDQVKLLEHADSVLARDQAAAKAAAAGPADEGGSGPAPGAKPSSGLSPGGNPGGGKSRPPPPPRRGGPDPVEVLNQQLDTLDSEAFLKAIQDWPEPQREKAIEIASRFREQLWEQREKERQH